MPRAGMGSSFADGRGPRARETEAHDIVRGVGARIPKATRAEVSTIVSVDPVDDSDTEIWRAFLQSCVDV